MTSRHSWPLSQQHCLELAEAAVQVGEPTQAIAYDLVRQRQVRAGARLDTPEATEDLTWLTDGWFWG
jgi:hypothetical protein